MGNTIAELIQMALDAIMYIIAIAIIAFCARTLTKDIYLMARYENINTTITQTEDVPIEVKGYTDSKGNEIYEGTLTGSCVFEDIINADESIKIAINGSVIPEASLKNYRSNKSGRVSLKNKLDLDGNYYRIYTTTITGEISGVDYKKY